MNFVSTSCWVRRGVSSKTPVKVKLGKDELEAVLEENKSVIEDLKEELEDAIDDEDGQPKRDDVKIEEEMDANANVLTDEEIADKYLTGYDNEEPASTLKIGSLAVFANNDTDPYLTIKDCDDEENSEKEDLEIKPNDNLIVVAHVEGDACCLEIYVYNDDENELYVHHDIFLSSMPLALEWLDYDPSSQTSENLVAVGYMTPVIEVWDLDLIDCLEPVFKLGKMSKKKSNKPGYGHKDAVLDIAWSHNNRHVLASGSADQTVVLWDMNQGEVNHSYKMFKDKVQVVSWHPFESTSLLTGCCDRYVRLLDCRSHNSKEYCVGEEIEAAIWNHFDAYYLLAGTDMGNVMCYDVRMDKPLWQLKAHMQGVTALSLSPSCPGCLITSSSDQTVKVWDILSGKPDMIMEKDEKVGSILSCTASPDQPFVVALGGDKKDNHFKVVNLKDTKTVFNRFNNRSLVHPVTYSQVTGENEMETEATDAMDNLQIQPSTSDSKKLLEKKKLKNVLPKRKS